MSALPIFADMPRDLPPAANAAQLTLAGVPSAGEILLACPVARGGIIMFGWHTARLPRQGTARIDGGGPGDGPFRLHAWRLDDHGRAWFVAAAQLPDPRVLSHSANLSLAAGGRPAIPLGALPAAACTPEALAERLAAEANGQPGPLALFLADLVIAAPRSAALGTLLRAFLARAATEDGVIEIVGQAGEALVLQGWGRAETDEAPVALLADARVSRHALRHATFARDDIRPPDGGALLLLDATAGIDAAALGAVYIAGGAALRRRRILPERRLLVSAELPPHLAGVLARLACDPDTGAALARLMRPRYAGHETLSALDRPVRAAIDVAVALPGAGVFVCGWLIDPRQAVRGVTLAAASGQRVRLDERWNRLSRPDVAEAFQADRRFASPDQRHLHGFAAFAPGMEAVGLHLDVEFDDTAAFLPVDPLPGAPRALLHRVLESLDLHQAGALAAIAGQLGPLLRAALRQGLELPAMELHRRGAHQGTRALLLPLPAAGVPPQVALAFLLADRLQPDESLVLVAPACWGDAALATLDRALELYGLDATVLRAREPCEWTELLDLAAHATAAASLLCLSPGLVGATTGWRQALQARLAALPDGSVVFPTALYEDRALRSVGVAAIERLAAAPWSRIRRPLAGHPADAVGDAATPLAAGSLAGALVSRAAWRAAGGFSGGFMLAEAQELGFFARLARTGGAVLHHGPAQVFVPDQAEPLAARWRATVALADGWLLANTQGDREGA